MVRLKQLPLVLLLCFLPILSVLGAAFVKNWSNNHLLLLLFITISALIGLSSRNKIPSRLYGLAIVAIASALLFQTTMVSDYLEGWDIHMEYYLAQTTRMNSRLDFGFTSSWPGLNNYNSMLSITILPVIMALVLNCGLLQVLTVVYPMVFSLVPLVLYKIYESQFGQRVAFFSVVFFMSFSVFYVEMPYLARQMVGELFFVLLLFLQLNKDKDSVGRAVMLIVFSAALVFSHYSLSYVYAAYVALLILLSWTLRQARPSSKQFTRSHLALFVVLAFSWYMFVSLSSPLISLATVAVTTVKTAFTEFLNLQTRDPAILYALSPAISIWRGISRIIFFTTVVLTGIGYARIWLSRRSRGPSPGYLSAAYVSVVLILVSVVLPNFAASLNMGRIYHIGLIISAPFCILGGDFAFRRTATSRGVLFWRLSKDKDSHFSCTSAMMTVCLITYFLFQSGFVYEITRDVPSSLSLTIDKSRLARENPGLYDAYTRAEEAFAAIWLSENMRSNCVVHSDWVSKVQVLASYGMLDYRLIVAPMPDSTLRKEAYVYLRSLNVLYGMWSLGYETPYTFDISVLLDATNEIYSNGASQVHYTLAEINSGSFMKSKVH